MTTLPILDVDRSPTYTSEYCMQIQVIYNILYTKFYKQFFIEYFIQNLLFHMQIPSNLFSL